MEKLLKELAEKIKGMSVTELESLKSKMSGVLGISEWGSDMMDGKVARWISTAEESKMPDSHFLWVKTEKSEDKSKNRKLPYKYPNGKLSRTGLCGAWAALYNIKVGIDLDGGDGKEKILAKCKSAIATYNRQNQDDKITINKNTDKGGDKLKYLKRDDIVDMIKGTGLDDKAHEQVIASMDNLVDESLKNAVAQIKKTWYKPETYKKKVDDVLASAKKKWDKELKDNADKKKKEDTKFAERNKAVSVAGFVMTDYREKLVKKMTIDENGDKEFNSFLEDLKKTMTKAKSTASNKNKNNKGFKPDVAGEGAGEGVKLAI